MESACPASVHTLPVPASFLSANQFQGLPTYDPQQMTHGYTLQGQATYTAVIFSVLNLIPNSATRYALPASGYWASAQNTTLDTKSLISILTQTFVPTKEYRMITPFEQQATAIATADMQTAVSYDLLYSLQFEFCFWLRVYKQLIADYIQLANSSTTALTEQQRQVVNALNSANLRLTDLSRIAQAIGDTQRTALATMNTQVNQFLSSMKTNLDTLKANSSDLTANDVASRFRARMVEYSEEKNAYATRMLALYGFANLIAVGLLFYIYRSTK